ncbi:MAG: hypothetical protein QI223_00095 [Candidatus Korarchaeota archaeon]|nr:hypothetical protein [Candidatus Korarchaeota archaeon]
MWWREVLALLAATLTASVASGVLYVAIEWVGYEATGTSLGYGLTLVFEMLPYVVTSVVAGWVVDRLGAKRAALLGLLLASAVSAASQRMLDLGTAGAWAAAVVASQPLDLWGYGLEASLPEVSGGVSPALQRLVSRISLADSVGSGVGYSLGGRILGDLGRHRPAALLSAALFLVSGTLFARLGAGSPGPSVDGGRGDGRRERIPGIRPLLTPEIVPRVAYGLVGNVLFGMGRALWAPVLSDLGPGAYGDLFLSMSLASAAAYVAMEGVDTSRRTGTLITTAFGLQGVTTLLFPVFPNPYVVGALFGVLGAVLWVSWRSYLLAHLPEGSRGRGLAVVDSVLSVALAAGIAAGGWLGDSVGVVETAITSGLLLAAFSAAASLTRIGGLGWASAGSGS